MAKSTRGFCKYCGKEYTRTGIAKHLQTCKKRVDLCEKTEKIEKYFEIMLDKLYLMKYNEDNKNKEATKRKASENGGRSNGLLNLTTKKSLNEFT